MPEQSCFSTVKLKNISKQEDSFLPLYFGLTRNYNFKFFSSFIDLGLHFDLCEHESYSTFIAKT